MATIRGGIKAGDAFLLVTLLTNGGTPTPAILNAAPSGNGVIYYWETNIAIVLASTIMPVFTATTTVVTTGGTSTSSSSRQPQAGNSTGAPSTALLIRDTINNGGMGYRQDGVTLGNAISPSPITISNATFAPWSDPYVLLANIPYSITNTTGHTAQIFLGNTTSSAIFPANNITILPVAIFGHCPQCAQITDPHIAAANWYCLTNPQGVVCGSVTTLNPSWTSLSDASSLLLYDYCPINKICGNNSCRGPCPQNYDDCNPSNGSFTCVLNPERYLTTVKWYESPYFIAAVIFIIIMIVLVILVAIVLIRRVGKAAGQAVIAGRDAAATTSS